MPSPGSDGVYSILEGGVTTADVLAKDWQLFGGQYTTTNGYTIGYAPATGVVTAAGACT